MIRSPGLTRKLVLSSSFAFALALITMGTAANATTLASGAIFGGTTQNNAICYLFNAGASPVSIVGKVQIISQFLGSLPLIFNGCGSTLNPGAICNVNANIANTIDP